MNTATVALTAIIKDAEIIRNPLGPGRMAISAIHGDVLRRFPDGHRIHTNVIRKGPNNKQLGQGYILTASGSLYKLEMKT